MEGGGAPVIWKQDQHKMLKTCITSTGATNESERLIGGKTKYYNEKQGKANLHSAPQDKRLNNLNDKYNFNIEI